MDALLPGGLDGVLPRPDAEREVAQRLPVRVQHEAGVALELRQAPRVAVDLLLRRRRRHALGLLLLSRGAAAREAAREGLLGPERRPWDQASRGADEEARDRHLFHFHGVANKNLRL